MRREHSLAFVALAVACGGGGSKADAPNSAPLNFQGEYVDWDSSAAAFCGILGATYTVAGSATGVMTPPNGRLMATVPPGVVEIDLMPPSGASPCAPGSGIYDNPGIIALDPVLVGSGVQYSTRAFTTDRRTSMFTQLGITYDPSAAQVLVNVLGTASAPQVAATHGATAAFDGSAWGSGETGVYVFFPNVDTSVDHTTLTATGYAQTLALPVMSGTFTYAAVSN